MRQKTLNAMRVLIGDYISSHIARENHHSVDYPVCETCGCLLPLTAATGKKEVRQKPNYMAPFVNYPLPDEDYIYTPHFCKKCAPVNEKEGPECQP